MKTVSLVFFKGKGVLSALIRWQTRGKFSHCGVLFNEDHVFFEAWTGSGKHLWNNGGVAKLEQWLPAPDVTVIPFGISDFQEGAMRAKAESLVGKKYDYRSVIRFLTRIKPEDNQKYFCSETAIEIFTAGEVKLLNAPASVISPAVLWFTPLI